MNYTHGLSVGICKICNRWFATSSSKVIESRWSDIYRYGSTKEKAGFPGIQGAMTWTSIVLCSLLASTAASHVKWIHKRHYPSRVVAHVGTTVNLNCSMLLSPRSNSTIYSNINWYKFGQPLSDVSYRPMAAVFKNGSHVLWLNNVLLADAGIYECIQDSTRGTHQRKRTFNLCVKETKSQGPPNIVNNKQRYKSAKAGLHVLLECRARSGTIPYFQWFYHSKQNTTNDKARTKENIFKKPHLVASVVGSEVNATREYQDSMWIHNATKQNSGLYVCLVFNKHGKDYQRIQLTVLAEPSESSTDLQVKHITTPDDENSLGSKIPMIILIALPAGLFILSCSAVIRSLEKTRQARLAKKQEANNASESKDENDNNPEPTIRASLPNIAIHTNYNYHNHIKTAQNYHINDHQFDSDIDSTSTASEAEADETSDPLDILSNLSGQSSCHMTSTEAPVTTSPPPELSSLSAGLELEWEGMDLVLPEGSELVVMSKEVDV